MKQIGLGAIMYANEHGGLFPDDLDTIVEVEDLPVNVLICPSTSGSPLWGPTTRASMSAMRQAKVISYIYVGKGLKVDASTDTVLAYEALSDHGDGMNVLFVDGHVEFLDTKESAVVLGQAAARTFPMRYPLAVGPAATQSSAKP
jgi:prepilin-type processing-associated H-X9-DG protein